MSGGGGGSQVVGYKYFMGLHMGICRGPVDELLEIRVGDRTAWPVDDQPGAIPAGPLLMTILSSASITTYTNTDTYGVDTLIAVIPGVAYSGMTSINQFQAGRMVTLSRYSRNINLPPATLIDVSGSYEIYYAQPNPGPGQGEVHLRIPYDRQSDWINFASGAVVSYPYPSMDLSIQSYPEPGTGGHDGVPATSSKRIFLFQPNLFGGDEKEGGIVGNLDVMMGEATQTPPAGLSGMLGGSLISGFRGMLTLFYDGLVASLNPYPKPWKFRVSRTVKGWDNDAPWYPAAARINLNVNQPKVLGGPLVAHPIAAMNPAHIVYECLTNKVWGRGLPDAFIDLTSFVECADTLLTEAFGLCLKWAREDTVEAFVQQVIDHIGAVLFVSRETALVTMKLVRSDYTVASLVEYTTSTGILSIEEDDTSTSQTLINEVVVKYQDPISGSQRQVRVQNIASQQATGAVLSKSIEYPGVPTAVLAARVAQRDLRANGTPLRRFKMMMDRRGYSLYPGAVFKFTDVQRNINDMVLRVGKVEDMQDGRIAVTSIQDVFGLPLTAYVGSQTGGGAITAAPTDPTYARAIETPYWGLLKTRTSAEFGAITGDQTFISTVGIRPTTLSAGYRLATSSDNGFTFDERGVAAWTPGALLSVAAAELDTQLTLTNLTIDTSSFVPGVVGLIGEEMVRVESVSITAGVMTATVGRGCLDTIPQKHSVNEVLYLVGSAAGNDFTTMAEGEIGRAKFLTRVASDQLAQIAAVARTVPLIGRHERPYPPGLLLLGGTSFALADPPDANFAITWANRNRVTQSDVVIPHAATNVTPEVGQTTTIIVRNPAGLAARNEVGLTGTSYSYDTGKWATDGSPDPLQIEVFSVRSTIESMQRYKIPMSFVTPDTSAHSYWRLRITAGNDAFRPKIAKLEFRATVGGADQCSGGTAIFSTQLAGAEATMAFDASDTTWWGPDTGWAFPVYVGYHFASAVSVNEVLIRAFDFITSPKNFQIQYSDDGTTWTTAFFRFDVTNWPELGGSQTFRR